MESNRRNKSLISFLLVSLVFGAITTFITLGGDDLFYIHRQDLSSISAKWKYVYDAYFTWSSRLLINFVWLVLVDMGKYAWGLYFALSLFGLFYAASVLFNPERNYLMDEFIIATVMSFPFIYAGGAGWIATITCYFGSLSAGMISLIPIARVYRKEKISIPEAIGCALCLMYAASDEQMMLVLLMGYFVANVFFFFRKQYPVVTIINLWLCVANLFVVMLSPGNSARKIQEIRDHFPDYLMLGLDDKVELGVSTALKWLIMDGHLFFIEFTLLIAIVIFLKYKDILFRVWGILPAVLTLLFCVADASFLKLFSSLSVLKQNVPYHGAITPANGGKGASVIQLIVLLFIVVIILTDIVLICDTIEELLLCLVLIVGGTASRVIMGFSPTIYVSGVRTFTIMIICFIFVSVFLGAKIFKGRQIGEKAESACSLSFWVMTVLFMLNYAVLVTTFVV